MQNDETQETLQTGLMPVLNAIDRGDLWADAETKLEELVAATQDTGKGGKLTITISITPNKKTGTVEVGGDVKATLPKAQRRDSVFFITPEGRLCRHDTRQYDLLERERRYGN